VRADLLAWAQTRLDAGEPDEDLLRELGARLGIRRRQLGAVLRTMTSRRP
jgi:hypothetical protein